MHKHLAGAIQLGGSVRQYKKDAILTPIFVSLEVLMEIIIPLLMANLIDFGIDDANMNYILKMGLALALSCVISLIFGALSGKFAASASAGFARNLRKDMYYTVQDYSFSNIDKFSTASIVTRLTTDVTNVQNAFQMIIRIAVRCPLMLIFSIVMVLRINPQISLIFLWLMPILALGMYLIMTKVYPIFERVFRTYDKLNNVVQENLHGIRVVKSFVREEFEDRKFTDVSQTIYKDFTKAEKILALNTPLAQVCMYAGLLLISWFGARLIVTSGGTEMSTGQLMSVISYATQILVSLMMLSMIFVMITMSRASAERIVEVLNEKSDIANPADPVRKVANGDVTFEHVNFRYAKSATPELAKSGQTGAFCLKNISLDIKSGQTVGIIGGTGSSKTSLVQLIPRLYDATEGVVKVGGVDVKKYDIETLRTEVAMVLQKNVLFSGTIKDNLRWGCENATDEEMVRVCKLAQADSFIQEFPDKYDTYIDQGGANVSGGQKQRLCIARALLKKPKILILDDSTSAVDTKTDALIRRAFEEEIPNTTKFIIAQRISSVEHADQIIVMENGRIDGCGTHEELLQTNAIYQEVYNSQTKGGAADGQN